MCLFPTFFSKHEKFNEAFANFSASRPLHYTDVHLYVPMTRYIDVRMYAPMTRYIDVRLYVPMTRYIDVRLYVPMTRYIDVAIRSKQMNFCRLLTSRKEDVDS